MGNSMSVPEHTNQTKRTDPDLLKQKAIEFLDKNYTRVKPGEPLPDTFYMLEPMSNNGMTKINMPSMHTDMIVPLHKYTSKYATSVYKNLSDGETHQPINVIKNIDLDDINNPVWYRSIAAFGESDAILGGRRKSKRKYKKHRKLR